MITIHLEAHEDSFPFCSGLCTVFLRPVSHSADFDVDIRGPDIAQRRRVSMAPA